MPASISSYLWETKFCIYSDITTILQACDSEEDGLFGFDLHSDGDGQRHVILIFMTKTNFSLPL